MLSPEKIQKYSNIYDKLVYQTLTYLRNNKLKTMILGVSGGIDSSVVAAICYGVYLKSNQSIHLYGVALPSLTNETVENEAAREIMESFCQHYMTVNIDDAVESLVDMCNSSMLTMTHLAKGNIKARTRMIYLYNMAQLTHGVVMDTDNATENFLGFYTIHGDQADICPMGDLWKSEVYELAEYIKEYKTQNEKQKHALGLSIALTPTDGNGVLPGGDMAQIAPGYTYNEVDQVCKYFKHLLNGGYKSEGNTLVFSYEPRIIEICQEQYKHIMDPETIKKVCDRHLSTKFKRQHLPIRFHI